MRMVDLIIDKREGKAHTREEINYIIREYTAGNIPDYQMSAWLMAVCWRGMTEREVSELTSAMMHSGDVVDLSDLPGVKVDKHSTGGVGDTTTLVIAPLVAACGGTVAKMSGRGLGHTGGTLDKLESVPGVCIEKNIDEFKDIVRRIGLCVIGQSGNLVPADKLMYALRDVTGTVESIPLIASSIMSKKLAAGSDAILLDVKCGRGAFMKSEEDARQLAEWMVEIGNAAGKKTMAVISDMNQPLGRAVGNALEVIEVMDVLKGRGPADITELSLTLAGGMIMLGGFANTMEEGHAKAVSLVEEGKALEKFREFVAGQGGNPHITEDYTILGKGGHTLEVKADRDGLVTGLDAMAIGLASQHIGAGRARKDDAIDMTAGIILNKKIGDKVNKGDVLCTLMGNDSIKIETGAAEAMGAYELGSDAPEKNRLIKQIIE